MKNFSSLVSSSLGNVLEWYDFGLFTIFSSLFSRLFFPNDDPHVAMIATISIFAVGFICRPIGALIFGYLGDTVGRAKTLRWSILMISIPTLLIGCLPSYEQVGIAAPIFLTLIRIWQGISIGGEYSGNIIYLAETALNHHRGLFTSLGSTGANVGILLASLVGFMTTQLLTTTALDSYGWRIPYLISGFLCILIYSFRLRIHETMVFDYLKNKKLLAINPIKIAFTQNYLQIGRTLGLVCMGTTFYYFCFIYIPIFLTQRLHFSLNKLSLFISLLFGFMIIFVPLCGWLCDKIGRRKMLLFNAALVMFCVIPGFYILQLNIFYLIVMTLSLFTVASSLEQGTTSISVVENFPPPARYTGLSFGYNLGNGLLGGTVPIICEWLMSDTGFSLAPAFYIAFCAAITLAVVFFFVPETRGHTLRHE